MYCDNYKCFVNFEFRPGPLQLLIGRNGTGKSTVFQVLTLLRDFAARGERCEGRFVGKTSTRWQAVQTQRFELDVSGIPGTFRYELVVQEAGATGYLKVHRESVTLDGKQLFLFEKGQVHLYNDASTEKVKFPLDTRRSGLAIVESRPENKKLSWFKNWLDQLIYVQIDPKLMGARAEKEAPHPTYNLDNYAEWYRHLRLESGYATDVLRRSLTDIIGGFESLDLRDAGLNSRILHVSAKVGGAAVEYAFDELSDGQRALIGLYTLLHCLKNPHSLLCIDEPDNFVALAEIQPWLSMLRDATESGLQVMLASHHPEVLNQLAPDHGVVLDRKDGRHTVTTPFLRESGSTLTPAEMVARGWELV
jgi:predicted ATPase